jgi:putative membrane protein
MSNQRVRMKVVLSAASLLVFAGASAFAQAPTGATPQQPSMPSQQQQPAPGVNNPMDAGGASAQSLNDQDFVHKALQGGDAEIQLGQLAQQKSQSEDVKQFGQKMVMDHTALGDKVIKPMAQALGVKEPKGLPKKDKQLIASLNQLSGPQFDQEYIKAMVKDHKQDLKDFKDEAEMSQNPTIKKAAEEGESMISQHLQLIEQIAQKHNVEAEK